MIADSYYFLRTQEHRQQDQPGLTYAKNNPNRLLLNIDDGQLPGIYKMEEFLQSCCESFFLIRKQLKSKLLGFEGAESSFRVDLLKKDLFRGFSRHFFNIHAA